MRKIASLALIISLIFLTCEKKEEPKEENKPPDTPVTETTIGQSGGKLKTPTFEIIVPAGAFLSNNTIKITEVEEESSFGESSISGQYLIEGLPDELSKPLKIKIKYTGTLSDQSFIAAGEEAMDAATGEADDFYEFLEGKDSSGFLIATYPPDSLFTVNSMAAAYKSVPGKKWIKLEVVSNFISGQYSWGGKHTYDIYLRKDINSLRPEIINYFDQSYNTFLSTLKFKYEFYFNTLIFEPYKINRILVTNVKEDIYCKYLWKINNKSLPGGIFVINAKKLNDAAGMQRMIAREVFRSILFQYDKAYPLMVPPSDVDHYWLNQALISWSEEFFVPDNERTSYVPSDFMGNELAPLSGLDYGSYAGDGNASSKVIEYGRGLSSMVKYLSFQTPTPECDTMWSYYYDNLIRIGAHPVSVMVARMNEVYNLFNSYDYIFIDNTKQIWLDFLHIYLTGLEYNVESSTFMNSITAENTFVSSSKDDTLKSFTRSYPELSAGLFKLEIQNEDVQKNSTLEISLKGTNNENAYPFVYGYKNGKLTLVAENKPVVITDLTSYDTYLILVGYDYFSSVHDTYTNLELQIRFTENKAPKFKYCAIQTELRRIRESDNFITPLPEPYVDTTGWVVRWYLKGSFTDNVFEAQIDTSKWGQSSVTGGGEIVLDDNNNLVSLHVVANFEGAEGYKSTWGIDCKNMSPKDISGPYLIYEATKNNTCQYIDQITGYYEDKIGYDKTLGFFCNDRSFVSIKFENDE